MFKWVMWAFYYVPTNCLHQLVGGLSSHLVCAQILPWAITKLNQRRELSILHPGYMINYVFPNHVRRFIFMSRQQPSTFPVCYLEWEMGRRNLSFPPCPVTLASHLLTSSGRGPVWCYSAVWVSRSCIQIGLDLLSFHWLPTFRPPEF